MQFRYTVYYGLCCIGLVGVIRNHIRFIYSLLFNENAAPLYEHIARWADKPIELFFFFLSAVFLLFYTLAVFSAWGIWGSNRSIQRVWQRECWEPTDFAWLLLICANNVLIGFDYWRYWFGDTGIWIADLLWALMICLPIGLTVAIMYYRKPLRNNFQASISGAKKIYILFIAVAFVQFVSIVWPFVAGPLRMMNEYFEIPTKTLVNGQYVDNSDYYSKNFLLGMHPRYHRERDGNHAPRPNPEYCLEIERKPGVDQLLKITQARLNYFYDNQAGLLCNTGPITPMDWLTIRQAMTTKDELLRAEAWLAKDIGLTTFWLKRGYSLEEIEFIDYNKFALEFQLNGIWVLHHHNFVLGPINEYALGKPQQEIFPQYGWLNMVITSHLLEWMGGITYEKYFRVWYSYYVVYFVLLLALFGLLFRHPGYVAIGSTLSVALMSYIPFVWYFQGPGLNPVRHFFDLFLIAGFYLYITNGRAGFLYGALLFGIIGILNNAQLGLACLGAMITATGVLWYKRSIGFNRFQLVAVIVATVLGGWLSVSHPFWSNGLLNQYYLMGISALPTSATRLVFILIVCGLLDLMLWRHLEKGNDRFKYLALFLLLYSQGALLYSLWGSTKTHFLALSTIHATTVVALLKVELDHFDLSAIKREISMFVVFLFALTLLVFGARFYAESEQEYEADFKKHESYVWEMERARFVASMQPELFENSVHLIKKHSSSNAIHIISKYDAIVPFLAKKYSAMPFFELSKFFTTPRELELSIEALRKDSPQILYVDNDIERDYTIDVMDPRVLLINHLQPFSVVRAKQFELLKKVFVTVKGDYELVEQGALISVYRRK